MDFPSTVVQFGRRFPDEESCKNYLQEVRWPQGFFCPRCGSAIHYFLKTRSIFKCSNNHQISLTSDTVLHNSRIPITTWFYGAWFVSTLNPGISARQFQLQLGLTRYETAWAMLHKLRSSLIAPERSKLCGEVEVDETFIGGRERGTESWGRKAKTKTLVAIAIEIVRYRDKSGPKVRAGRIRLRVIENSNTETLERFVTENVAPETLVHTDGHSSYRNLEALGYRHKPLPGNKLPTLHRVITNIKTWLRGTYKGRVEKKHLQSYLEEFTYRFNRRHKPWMAFNRTLGLAARTQKSPTYEELYTKGE